MIPPIPKLSGPAPSRGPRSLHVPHLHLHWEPALATNPFTPQAPLDCLKLYPSLLGAWPPLSLPQLLDAAWSRPTSLAITAANWSHHQPSPPLCIQGIRRGGCHTKRRPSRFTFLTLESQIGSDSPQRPTTHHKLWFPLSSFPKSTHWIPIAFPSLGRNKWALGQRKTPIPFPVGK